MFHAKMQPSPRIDKLTMKILTSTQMNEVDRLTSDQFHLPSLVLMENAGLNLYYLLREYFSDLENLQISIVCGKGNNGGDGIVLARHLIQRNRKPSVYLLCQVQDVSGDARVNLDAYLSAGAEVIEVTSEQQWQEISPALSSCDIIVDALLGTGINKPLNGLYSRAVSTINLTDAFVLCVDIPSGMFSDSLTGDVQTVQADATVTFAAPKVAHVLNDDQEAIGDLHVVPIGTPAVLLDNSDYYLNLVTREQVLSYLPPRKVKSHKGDLGHVALVAGSRGKSGAAVLSGTSALRTGSGLVTVYTPRDIQDSVSCFQPELMTEGLPSTALGALSIEAADSLLDHLQDKDAVGIGPGLTREKETTKLVHQVVRQSPVPMVIDADALNAFEGEVDLLSNARSQPLVLTPHPGEFSRMIGKPTGDILTDRVTLSREFAQERGVWLVLKGFRTLVAEPTGQVFVCPLGNPGMATAGMGDVLTGVLTAMVGLFAARGLVAPTQISQAVVLGVYLHSLAGDLAEIQTGPESLSAGDAISHLSQAYRVLATGDLENDPQESLEP